MNFEFQIRAIRYAIKELQRERMKALEAKNQEWVDDVEFHILHLTKSIETIQAMSALQKVIAGYKA
jgi:hypothetical protein